MKNKILVSLYLESGCNQDEDETNIEWIPINFCIYSDLFPEIISESICQWLSENQLNKECFYELIMQHVIEHDGAGVVHSEYFEVINVENETP